MELITAAFTDAEAEQATADVKGVLYNDIARPVSTVDFGQLGNQPIDIGWHFCADKRVKTSCRPLV